MKVWAKDAIARHYTAHPLPVHRPSPQTQLGRTSDCLTLQLGGSKNSVELVALGRRDGST
mgnify:CR=1 FL=1